MPFSRWWTLAAAALVLALCPTGVQGQGTPYPHADEPIGTVREIYDGVLSPDMAVRTFRNIDRLFPSATVPRASRPRPLPVARAPLPAMQIVVDGMEYSLSDFLELNRVAGLLVLHDGQVKLEQYRFGNTERTRWMSMSVAKSVMSTLFGVALRDGLIGSLTDPVTRYVPSLTGSAYDGVSVRDVLMMASGVQWSETYTDPASDRRRLLEAQIAQQPGGALGIMRALPRAAEPGYVNNYNTGETQVAAEVLRNALGRPLAAFLHDRIWEPFGMEADATWWLDSPDGVEIGGSGFSATLRDYGRFGLFVLEHGLVDGESILPEGWMEDASTPKVLNGGAPLDYGYLWWPGTSAAARRDRAYLGRGIHGQYLYVNPVTQVVVVVWSAQPHPTGDGVVDEWAFFEAVDQVLRNGTVLGNNRLDVTMPVGDCS